MKIAIEGCCHGELDTIYSSIASQESQHNFHVDLLLVCGDFEAIRNYADLQCMAVPDKYKVLGTFHKYYTGEKIAPILTIVIGGNHEASNYFWELFHGGWLAPNIYFLGHAGSVLVNGIRISGASGIFKGYNFHKGYFERQPYNKDDLRSIYHIRESSIRQLSLLPPLLHPNTSIFLSHDWPHLITSYASRASVSNLLRRKPHFRADIEQGTLGSPPLMGLMKVLRPRWWFSAHMHVGWDVGVRWVEEGKEVGEGKEVEGNEVEVIGKNPDEIVIDDGEEEKEVKMELAPPAAPPPVNPDEIMLDDDLDDVVAPPPPPPPPPAAVAPVPKKVGRQEEGTFTQWVALDKCLPKRKFLEFIDVDTSNFTPPLSEADTSSSPPSQPHTPHLTYDPTWLAITRAFHPYISLSHSQKPFPDEPTAREMVRRELDWVEQNVPCGGLVKVGDVQVFSKTADGPSGGLGEGSESGTGMRTRKNTGKQDPPQVYLNPQTEAFCRMLKVENFVNRDGVVVGS